MPGRSDLQEADTGVVLIVEGDVLIRITIAEYLRGCGFRVIEAVHADEAMTVLDASGLEVNIIISAVELPGAVDGFALSRLVRSRQPAVPVLLAGTAGRAIDMAEDLCKSGPDLARPYEPQLVRDRIRRMLAERARRSPPPSPARRSSVPPQP